MNEKLSLIKIPKRYISVFLFILLIIGVYFFLSRNHQKKMSKQNQHELSILNDLIQKKDFFRDSLRNEMDSVMMQLHKQTNFTDEYRYLTNRRMCEKAQMFSYDYASQFSHKMRILSDKLGDKNLIAESRILSSFNLSQACLFVEALEMLESVDPETSNLNDSILSLYYFYYGITYQRLAVYVNDSVNANRYNNLGNQMFKKCINYSDNQGINNFAWGRIYGRQRKYDIAQRYFEKALKYINKDNKILLTLANASLGKCCKHQGKHEQATLYYIEATKNSIQNAQNSSIAIIDLTEHLFKQYHDTRNVSKYVNIAIENGEFYGMRSQITHIDRIIPDITKQKSRQNHILTIFFIIVFIIFSSYIMVVLLNYEKNIKLLHDYEKKNKNATNEINHIREENNNLTRTCQLLRDSNKLKDVYLGKLLESNSELTNIFGEFAIKAEQKMKKSQYEQVLKALKEMDKNFSKKEQLVRFDELFMSMFPTFVADFNALLEPEYRKQGEKELLTPAMRIFALIRLGISNNQQIARVLNYSYNTILNYRIRVRGMAINSETFEKEVMKIGS